MILLSVGHFECYNTNICPIDDNTLFPESLGRDHKRGLCTRSVCLHCMTSFDLLYDFHFACNSTQVGIN